MRIFQKTLFYDSDTITVEGSSVRNVFVKLMICYVFFKIVIFEGSGAHFFALGRFQGPPKFTLALQQACFYLGESTIFTKICVFIKNQGSKKT